MQNPYNFRNFRPYWQYQFPVWTVYFMKKLRNGLLLLAALGLLAWLGGVAADRQQLGDRLVRLHVVANSDSRQDQAVKLQVRDAVLAYLAPGLPTDPDQAKVYLQQHLPGIQAVANDALAAAGQPRDAVVTLCREPFARRQYDTFTLPAGVYSALRIVLGQGQGRNWWCVVFPQLCVGAAAQHVEQAAAGAGFSQELCRTITRDEGYTLRFFALDVLGQLENLLFAP